MTSVAVSEERPGERSIGELFGELATETSTLVRQELALATLELTRKAAYAARQVVYVAVATCFGLVAMVAMSAAGVVGLSRVLPLWVSALAVGGAFAVVALAIGVTAVVALKRLDPSPTQTLLSLKETKSWATKTVQ